MAKQTGLGANLWVNQYNVSGDVGAIDSISSSREQLDVTVIEDTNRGRLPGVGDGSIAFTSFFDRTAGHVHDAFGSAFSATQTQITAALGTAIGDSAASILAQKATYNVARGTDGSLVMTSSAENSGGYGVDWGRLLNARASATGTATTTVDDAAASTAGAVAYLHITAVAAGTVTIVVQDSPDNASFTNVTGLSFTASSTATSQALATSTSATIARYLRYNCSGGTATFALNVARNPA